MSRSDFNFIFAVCIICITCVSCDYLEDKRDLDMLEKERAKLSIELLELQIDATK